MTEKEKSKELAEVEKKVILRLISVSEQLMRNMAALLQLAAKIDEKNSAEWRAMEEILWNYVELLQEDEEKFWEVLNGGAEWGK